MTRTEITDEMLNFFEGQSVRVQVYEIAYDDFKTLPRNKLRKFLDAALNPPQPEEIVVTEEMRGAGASIADEAMADEGDGEYKNINWPRETAIRIYRAMASLDPTRHKARNTDKTESVEQGKDLGRGPYGPEEGWVRTRHTHVRGGDALGRTHRRNRDEVTSGKLHCRVGENIPGGVLYAHHRQRDKCP